MSTGSQRVRAHQWLSTLHWRSWWGFWDNVLPLCYHPKPTTYSVAMWQILDLGIYQATRIMLQ